MKKLRIFNTIRFFYTLRFKMIASFLIPIGCIILLGIVSFDKASHGIIKNYEKATIDSINMAAEFLRFGFKNVEASAVQYVGDSSFSTYLRNTGEMMELNNTRKNIQNSFQTKKITDEFIGNIYILTDTSVPISTLSKSIEAGVYTGFTETLNGEYIKNNRLKSIWIGEDNFLDEKLGTKKNDYSLRLLRYFVGVDAILIVDINANTVNQIMNNLGFDETGFLGFITPDGRELISKSTDSDESGPVEAKNVFTSETFYQEAINNKEDSGTKYVDYRGEQYLFLYAKVGDGQGMLCGLMPNSAITKQADSIKEITVIIVIVACILGLITAVLLSIGVDRVIKNIISKLKKASRGDLNVSFTSKRKDEFKILMEELETTFHNMKELIYHVKAMSREVSLSSNTVSKTSEEFLLSFGEISIAMNEIEQGIQHQSNDAEECLTQMDNLSKRMEIVSQNTKEIGAIADNTKNQVHSGTLITDQLNQQTKSTIAITTNIISEIENLAQKSSSINNIINVINEIANQTNLLSLNASIEAARAGEHGKGFLVVASEIRNLAEQSKHSVNNIKDIIESIIEDTRKTVDIANQVDEALKLQENAVSNTTIFYNDINGSVEKLLIYLKYITENVSNMEEARITTLKGIENISAVLEEIAASSSNVNQTSNKQLSSVEALSESATRLNNNVDMLVREVQKFQV